MITKSEFLQIMKDQGAQIVRLPGDWCDRWRVKNCFFVDDPENWHKRAAIIAIYGRKGGRLGQKCNFIKWQDQTTPADFQNYLQTMITE
jgi:hypothetical protein